tara:strand:- start:321 stop:836 length:516 start_codon:yes stop_codon:yes gene_type:complete
MLIFDIETDGLLENVSTIHCLVIHDTDTGQTIPYNSQGNQEPLSRGVQRLEDSDIIAGHNIINYDLPVIHKVYPWFTEPSCVIDTLILSRIYHADMMKLDKKHNWKSMPLQLYGRHSLESYGHRLNEHKGTFGTSTDWKEWSQEMEDYCIQDVTLTTRLWQHFLPYLTTSH